MNWTGLAARLEKKYGLGENPHASRRVYRHVERLCHTHGDPVYIIVCEMVQYADLRSKPGNNFRAYVLERIEKAGFPTNRRGPNEGPGERPSDAAVQQNLQAVQGIIGRVAAGGHDDEF